MHKEIDIKIIFVLGIMVIIAITTIWFMAFCTQKCIEHDRPIVEALCEANHG